MKSLGGFVIAGLFVVAAAFEQGAYFESRTIIIPHDEKIHRGGEDSAHATDTMIAVADGVGGWADSGVNPGFFSKLLTRTIKELHLNDPQKSTRRLAIEAHRVAATKFDGSATLVVVKIDSEDTISTTIIGDSGYALFHVMNQENGPQKLQLYFRAEEQQKSFNFPYQIGSIGDDPVTSGKNDQHKFQDGDVLLVYSDGVGDNLFDSQFIPCVEKRIENGLVRSYGDAANCLAKLAYRLGKDKNYKSPFQVGARKSGQKYWGGKHDDITITVAQIFRGDVGRPRFVGSGVFPELVTVYHEQPQQTDTGEEVKKRTKPWDEL